MGYLQTLPRTALKAKDHEVSVGYSVLTGCSSLAWHTSETLEDNTNGAQCSAQSFSGAKVSVVLLPPQSKGHVHKHLRIHVRALSTAMNSELIIQLIYGESLGYPIHMLHIPAGPYSISLQDVRVHWLGCGCTILLHSLKHSCTVAVFFGHLYLII